MTRPTIERLESRLCLAAPTAVLEVGYVAPDAELVLRFDQSMAPSTVTDAGAYQVTGPNGDVPVDSASYDPATHRVVLDLNGAGTLAEGTYRLGVLADRITNSAGEFYRGDPDLAVTLDNTQFGKLPIQTGQGDGTFRAFDVLVAGHNLEHMTAADVNGDGVPDLITSQSARSAVYVYLSQPGGGYGTPDEYSAGGSITDVAAADLNGDGNADIVVTSLENQFTVLLNSGSGTFSTANYPTPDRAKSVALADFDEDGTIDAAVSVENVGVIVYFNTAGAGDFSNPTDRVTVTANTPSSIVAADVDQDGRLDVAAAGPVSRSTTVLYGRSGRAFDVVEYATPGFPSSEVAVGDVNGDGVNDLVMASSSSQQVMLLVGSSTARQYSVHQSFSLGNTPSGLAVSDLNHDGFADVLVSTDNTNSRPPISLFMGEASGLGPRDFVSAGASGPAHDIVVGEFDPRTRVGSFVVDGTAPSVTLDIDAVTTDTTPEVTVTVSDNHPIPDGTTVVIDVDLNSDGDFTDSGESGYATSQLAGGAATFDLSPALAIGQYAAVARAPDQAGNEGTSNVTTFRIVSPNNPPTANDDDFVVEKDRTNVLLDVLANDSTDPDSGEQLTIIATSAPDQGGTITIPEGGASLVYTPASGYLGAEHFTYTISDGNGGEDVAEVTIRVNTEADDQVRFQLHTFDADGHPISRVPVGGSFIVQVTAEDVRTGPSGVFAAFADIFYSPNLLEAATPVTFGPAFPYGHSFDLSRDGLIDELGGFGGFAATGAGARVVATIPFQAEAIGTATFTTDMSDLLPSHEVLVYLNNQPVPADQIDFGTRTIEITAAVDAVDDSFHAQEDSVDNSLDVLRNDFVTPGGSLSVVQLSVPDQGGAAAIAPDGRSVRYSPRPDFVGIETFTYRVDDGSGATDEATVVVQVDNVNDPPTAIDDYVPDLLEDSVDNRINVLRNDDTATDVGETLSVIGLGATSHGGAISIAPDQSAVIYSPARDFFGKETFTYTITDGNGGEAQATVTVEVRNVNDDPTANDDTYSLTKGAPTAALAVLANDSTMPDVGETLVIVSVGATSQNGSAVISADGKRILYTPAVDFAGVETFTYSVSDGNGGADTATVTIIIAIPWQNVRNHLDVNDDGHVTPIDALWVINDLQIRGPRLLPVPATQIDGQWMYLDVNGDGFASPIDALIVINFLNGQGDGEGEGANNASESYFGDALDGSLLAFLPAMPGSGDGGRKAADDPFATSAFLTPIPTSVASRPSGATTPESKPMTSIQDATEANVDWLFESDEGLWDLDDQCDVLARDR